MITFAYIALAITFLLLVNALLGSIAFAAIGLLMVTVFFLWALG